MIKKNNKIFTEGGLEKLPEPFNKVSNVSIPFSMEHDGEPTLVPLIPAVFKALVFYLANTTQEYEWNKDFRTGIAMGEKIGENGESIIFVEHHSKSRSGIVDIVSCDGKGKIKASFYNVNTKEFTPYKIKGKGGTDGTAIILALIPKVLSIYGNQNSDLSLLIKEMHQISTFENKSKKLASLNDLFTLFLKASFYLKNIITDQNFPCDLEDKEHCTQILKAEIDNGHFPLKEKTIFGQFEILTGTIISNEDIQISDGLFSEGSYSDVEKDLIPDIPSYHTVSPDEKFIIEEVLAPYQDDIRFKPLHLILRGKSSTGKSHLAKIIAARMKRPFVVFNANPETDRSTVFGSLLPVINGENEKNFGIPKDIQNLISLIHQGQNTVSAICMNYNLPTKQECEEKAFVACNKLSKLTGLKIIKSSTEKAKEIREQFIASKEKELERYTKSLSEGDKKGESMNDSVEYFYYKSAIVDAIENGWVVEIQEFNTPRESSVFTEFNHIFDVTSNGIVKTPYGTIKRHPNFLAISTCNPGYAGTREVNESILHRAEIYDLDEPNRAEIIKRCKAYCEVPDRYDVILDTIVDTYIKLRNLAEEMGTRNELTLRELYSFTKKILYGSDIGKCVKMLISAATHDAEEKEEMITFAMESTSIYNVNIEKSEDDDLQSLKMIS